MLGPIFASASHGYDTIDHFRIDPRLGDDADFDALIEAARKRGLKVVLDGVFNHVSRRHPAFEEVLAQGPAAPSGLMVPSLVAARGPTRGRRPRRSRAITISSRSTTTHRRSKTSSPRS